MHRINITKPGQAPATAESRWQNLGCCSPPWTSLVLRTKAILKPMCGLYMALLEKHKT